MIKPLVGRGLNVSGIVAVITTVEPACKGIAVAVVMAGILCMFVVPTGTALFEMCGVRMYTVAGNMEDVFLDRDPILRTYARLVDNVIVRVVVEIEMAEIADVEEVTET